MNETINLAGTTVRHAWTTNPWMPGGPKPTFVTVICDDETLVWNNVTDPDNPTAEKERYVRTDLAEGVIQVAWRESPDTTDLAIMNRPGFGGGSGVWFSSPGWGGLMVSVER